MRLRLASAGVLLIVGLAGCGGDAPVTTDAAGAPDAGDAGSVGRDGGDTLLDAAAPHDAGHDGGGDAGRDAGGDAGRDAGYDAGYDAGPDYDAGDDAGLLFGCPSHPDPTAAPGEDIGGHTYATWAAPMFFELYCTRCHSSSLTNETARSFAPLGLDWDIEANVRAELARIRFDVGVSNYMPPTEPRPSCDERYELLRWIDSGAP